MQRRLIGVGAVGVGIGIMVTPFGNNLAKNLLYHDDEVPTPERIYPQEMNDAAHGGTFDMSLFDTDDRSYTNKQNVIDDTIWYTGTLSNRRVNAAAACGLLAANEIPIPQGAKDGWKAAEALPSTTEAEDAAKDAAYNAVGTLCVNAFPVINPEGTPETALQAKKVTIIVDAAS